MKIQLASDLHLEFYGGNTWKAEVIVEDMERDVLVLAGDIALGTGADAFILEQMKYSDVIMILGNHEGYHQVYPRMLWAWKGPTTKRINKEAEEKGIKGRLYFLDNDEVILGGTRFLGCPLWTDFNNEDPIVMNMARTGMNDYHLTMMDKGDIYSYDGQKLQPEITLGWHNASVKFLKKKLAEDFDGKTVVITHHLPSERSVPEMYKGEVLNGAYFTNLEYMMEEFKYELHVHGHTHNSFDYMVDETRVVCNPRGYSPRDLNPDYDNGLILEV